MKMLRGDVSPVTFPEYEHAENRCTYKYLYLIFIVISIYEDTVVNLQRDLKHTLPIHQ